MSHKQIEKKDNRAELWKIEECLEIVFTAHCSYCQFDRHDNTDESAFAKNLYYLGWRSINDELFCPECAKNHH